MPNPSSVHLNTKAHMQFPNTLESCPTSRSARGGGDPTGPVGRASTQDEATSVAFVYKAYTDGQTAGDDVIPTGATLSWGFWTRWSSTGFGWGEGCASPRVLAKALKTSKKSKDSAPACTERRDGARDLHHGDDRPAGGVHPLQLKPKTVKP